MILSGPRTGGVCSCPGSAPARRRALRRGLVGEEDGVDVVVGERDLADARSGRRRASVAAVGRRRMKRRQLESAVPVWALQDGDLRPGRPRPRRCGPTNRPRPALPSPSVAKDATASCEASTTMPTCSIRSIVICSILGARLGRSVNCCGGTDRAARARHRAAPFLPALDWSRMPLTWPGEERQDGAERHRSEQPFDVTPSGPR
jgi:hypothetical protein